ncbi:RagB/SusD family nutrient uptake outer membrane protein [uncultured Polaribacter sp.]|uniref:RagB/SusD family nutrient uptake outer membrane protein n=1 Tax=uncultured Polaribacter sp. TaxID=174711 RepID=UPI00260F920A|nr:RagB/SusD family nutrient uptake outer membrane protein [uncultured Polaribacter sp.]
MRYLNNIKHYHYGALLLLFCLLVGCNDGFLEETPTESTTPELLLVDKEGAQLYLNGAYHAAKILGYGGHKDPVNNETINGWATTWGSIATDEVVVASFSIFEIDLYTQRLNPTTIRVRQMWEDSYVAINKINSTIDRIGAMTDDQIEPEDKANFVAQAKFLRAAIYFNMVVAWENIPLLINEIDDLSDDSKLQVAQNTTQEVYDFIISDLLVAESVLTNEQGGGKATKGAAQSLLGKVYLQMTGFPLNQSEKFALAKEKLEAVIASGVYQLEESYPEIFSLNNEQNKEIIFAIGNDSEGQNLGGLVSSFYGPNGDLNSGGGWNTAFLNLELEADYDRDDVRLRQNVAKHNAQEATPEEGFSDPSTWGTFADPWKPWKWHRPRGQSWANNTPFDSPIIRYADVLLLYAESLNGMGILTQADIDATVNRLRARAREDKPPTVVSDMFLSNPGANASEILLERQKELCFEGWRRHDLIRNGVYGATIIAIDEEGSNRADNPGLNWQPYKIRWPIPDSEIRINPNLKQNEGY